MSSHMRVCTSDIGLHAQAMVARNEVALHDCFNLSRGDKSTQERATRVRACNYIKIETGWNFPPVLKIVTCTAQAA